MSNPSFMCLRRLARPRIALRTLWLALCVAGISACSDKPAPEAEAAVVAPSNSAGQVAPAASGAAAPQVSFYAASRFAEQASFGPTPALVAEIRSKGFAKWIDDQFALPASQIDPTPFLAFVDPAPDADWRLYLSQFPSMALHSNDQLRLRVTWSLSQFITVSDRKGDLVGMVYWINLLQNRAFGRYDQLLYQVSTSPTMGQYLDNNQNRPKSAECPNCAPNENFARELMQLFSIGVVRLNVDGTAQRNSKGALIETYTQRDVEELARVLTGWRTDPEPQPRPNRNWANWSKPMIPTTWPPERDSGAKTVMGTSFAAGQSQPADLNAAITMLMAHPNIAPFVATRLIQHLVKSNPTPAYVGRIANVFRNNGAGVAGDLKAMVKTTLLDAEARAGDVPGAGSANDGKLREPFLQYSAAWRGMGCTQAPVNRWGPMTPQGQRPFSPESVFSFYAPSDRAPGSNLLAPEQKLLTANELTSRLNLVNSSRWDDLAQQNNLNSMNAAGCNVAAVINAYAASPRAYLDLLSERYFRGAMPPTLRANIEQIVSQKYPPWDARTPDDGALRMLDYALASPYFGVIK